MNPAFFKFTGKGACRLVGRFLKSPLGDRIDRDEIDMCADGVRECCKLPRILFRVIDIPDETVFKT